MEDITVFDLIGYTTSQFCPKCKTFLVLENEIGEQWCEDCDWEKSSEEMEEMEEMEESLALCEHLGYQIRLLPSEQKEKIEKAFAELEETNKFAIFEPCNCGSLIMHNNGGNYHEQIYLQLDNGKAYVKYETTCELVAPAEWQECDNPGIVIREHADWL